jgi:hypothetical protein
MRSDQRLRRLEEAAWERRLRSEAERMAARMGVDAEAILRQFTEIADRIARGGMDAEIRHFADETGMSIEEARARYEDAYAEVEAEQAAEGA